MSELSEFRNLNKIAPYSIAKTRQFCEAIEKFIRTHPELRREIEAFYSTLGSKLVVFET